MITGFIFLNMDGCGLEDMFTQIFIQTKNQLGIVMMTTGKEFGWFENLGSNSRFRFGREYP